MSPNQNHVRVDAGNVPENPLRSYRMAMLAHGLRLENETSIIELQPDQSRWLTYSVGPLRRKTSLGPTLIALAVVIALFVVVAAAYG